MSSLSLEEHFLKNDGKVIFERFSRIGQLESDNPTMNPMVVKDMNLSPSVIGLELDTNGIIIFFSKTVIKSKLSYIIKLPLLKDFL